MTAPFPAHPGKRTAGRRISALSLMAAALLLLGATAAYATPNSPGPLLWTAPGGVDNVPIDSVACPSTALCVAVDRSGNVLWSTHPASGPTAWRRANVDGRTEITSISCPATNLCVAVDGSGNVITSSNPTGGSVAWTESKFDTSPTQNNSDNAGAILDRGVSCPSTGLCVAVDAAGNALVSADPTGGPSAWTTVHIDTNSSFGCAGGGLACQPPLTGVACPSVTVCAAVDYAGNLLTTGSPTTPAPWTSTPTDGGGLSSLYGISCPVLQFCATVDGGVGRAITLNPAAPAAQTVKSLPYSLYGIWCQSASLCLASVETYEGVSGLLGSFNPAAPASTWSLSSLGGINSVACLSAALCIAADDEGNVAAGLTTTAIKSGFAAELLSTRHLPTIATMDKRGSDKLSFTSPIAATVSLNWTVAGPLGTRRVLATVTHRYVKPGLARLTLPLTATGVQVFAAATKRFTLTASATFAASTGSITVTKRLTFIHPPKPPRPKRHKK